MSPPRRRLGERADHEYQGRECRADRRCPPTLLPVSIMNCYPVIFPGLSLGLSSPRFGGTPDGAGVAQLALNLHVSAFRDLYERERP